MKFEILNVEHGFCAYAIADDDSVLLFDCGHSTTCQPSTYLLVQGKSTIHRLFVTNYDEDHIADLPMLRKSFDINILTRNPSVNYSQLRNMKTPPLSSAMNTLIDMIDTYTGTVSIEQLELSGIQVQTFFNKYPTFTDTNNLSLLTFLKINGLCFALTGDLEKAGWEELLKNSQVCESLRSVDIFVASHHGRESGYCSEVFKYCYPKYIIMSDGPVQYDTQEMASVYGQHAIGGLFKGKERKVLTTRKDNSLVWLW